MKIINSHVHAIDIRGMMQAYPLAHIPGGISSLSQIESTLPLLSPSVILKQMDEAGIEQSVLFAVDAPIVYASHAFVGSLCEAHPDRFIGFGSINPLRPDAVNLLEEAFSKYQFRGIKFHPPLQGFSPNDERVFPVYEFAEKHSIPVVFHVGSTPFGALGRLAFARPILLDDVAVRFPCLRILLTHLGTLWENEAFMVAEKNPNVYIDTAAYLYEIEKLLTPELVARVGDSKFIFGTDYPMPSSPGQTHRMLDFVETIKKLNLTNLQKEMMFSTNFMKLLNPPESQDSKSSDTTLNAVLAKFQGNS